MKKLISGKYIIVHFVIVGAFAFAFSKIGDGYIKDNTKTPHAIDVHFKESCRYFDAEYIINARDGGYNIPAYYKSFFPLDLFFPIAYTLFLLSIASLWKQNELHKSFVFLIFAGAIFDYLENFSFALFLQLETNGFAKFVAFFSTIKSILVEANVIIAIVLLVSWALRRWLQKPRAV